MILAKREIGMNDQVRETLTELIKKYGTSLVDELRRLEGFLRDLCGENKREIFVIITALKARVAESLLTLPQGIPLENGFHRIYRGGSWNCGSTALQVCPVLLISHPEQALILEFAL
jgi:hypothetical protein